MNELEHEINIKLIMNDITLKNQPAREVCIMPKTHELAIMPKYFDAIQTGKKTFEIRRNDRDFHLGDILILQEFDSFVGYTCRQIKAVITYIFHGGKFGLEEGYCIMSLGDIHELD